MKAGRRNFLIGTAGAIAVVPLGYALRVSFGGYKEVENFKHLSAKDAAVVWAIIEAVIPPNNALGIDPDRGEVLRAADRLFDSLTTLARSEVAILLWAVEHVFPAFSLKFSKFTDLSREEREAIIVKLDSTNNFLMRFLARAMKTVASVSYFTSGKVHARLGHGGWCGS